MATAVVCFRSCPPRSLSTFNIYGCHSLWNIIRDTVSCSHSPHAQGVATVLVPASRTPGTPGCLRRGARATPNARRADCLREAFLYIFSLWGALGPGRTPGNRPQPCRQLPCVCFHSCSSCSAVPGSKGICLSEKKNVAERPEAVAQAAQTSQTPGASPRGLEAKVTDSETLFTLPLPTALLLCEVFDLLFFSFTDRPTLPPPPPATATHTHTLRRRPASCEYKDKHTGLKTRKPQARPGHEDRERWPEVPPPQG